MLVTPETRRCPFCASGHRLRLHGTYTRFALLPDPEPELEIPVVRLFCPVVRRTVSLLPDFCIPRRQHGPAQLLALLVAWIAGTGLLASLRTTRATVAGHSVAQSLLRGFRDRIPLLRAYLAGVRPRATELPPTVPIARRPVADVFLTMVADALDPMVAFLAHGVGFHRRFARGLA